MRSIVLAALLMAGDAWCGWVPSVHADIPRTIHYQGRLTHRDGLPLQGAYVVTVRFFGAATGGQPLWQEQHAVQLGPQDNGRFAVTLGSRVPFGETISFNDPLWLTTEIDEDGELLPRQLLSAVSYAINADMLDGLDSSELLAASRSIDVTSLPDHSRLHRPGATDALPTGTPVGVGAANREGTASRLARADHGHAGVRSIGVAGETPLEGEIALAAGPGVRLVQEEQTITIDATGAAAAGDRVSVFREQVIEIAARGMTELISATIETRGQDSVVLILATIQLAHGSAPTNKEVDLTIFRGAMPLDAPYQVRIGRAPEAVSAMPVTLHAWDTPGQGSYTYYVRAQASARGAEAQVRRLTVIELP